MKYYFIAGIIAFFFSYAALALLTDFRIDRLRDPINKVAFNEGIKAGVEAYKREYRQDESIRQRKRRIRDAKLLEFTKKMEALMIFEEKK